MDTETGRVVAACCAALSLGCDALRVEPIGEAVDAGMDCGPGGADESCAAMFGAGSLGSCVCDDPCESPTLVCSPSTPVPLAPANDEYLSLVPGDNYREATLRWRPATPGTAGANLRYLVTYGTVPDLGDDESRSIWNAESITIGDLALRTEPPVGERFFWRVRACRLGACSAWSPVRYFTVGDPHDLDGDGFGEIVVAHDSGTYVFKGGLDGVRDDLPDVVLDVPPVQYEPYVTLPNPYELADLDGNGFADLTVRAADGRTLVHLGRATWPAAPAPDLVIAPDAGQPFDPYAAGGDMNGDGFDELVAGGRVWFGSPTGPEAGPSFALPETPEDVCPVCGPVAIASLAGDFDGDGLRDLLLGGATDVADLGSTVTPWPVHLLRGVPGLALGDDLAAADLVLPLLPGFHAVLDLSGDALADVAVSLYDLAVFPGDGTGLAPTPAAVALGVWAPIRPEPDGRPLSRVLVEEDGVLHSYTFEIKGRWAVPVLTASGWALQISDAACGYSDFARTGDFDGDGEPEIAVGYASCDRVDVYSDGTLIERLVGPPGSGFGRHVR